MSQELIYTSAPRGLKPGSQGFCTVVATQGMSAALQQRLESLSGYRHVFPPQDASAQLNPVICSHLVLNFGGRRCHVLSRICDAGLDHTQRNNKFAHHVVLDPRELPPGGPAWLLAAPGFMQASWDGAPKLLPAAVPGGNLADGTRSVPATLVCRAWQQAAGDAGWGGALAKTAMSNRAAVVVFRPGTDPLPLLAEALALLPAERRWGVTFSTYFNKLPPGIDCLWRCVVEGSPEALSARTPGGLIIDLCRPLAAPAATPLVQAARTGLVPTAASPGRPRSGSPAPVAGAYRASDEELEQLLGEPAAAAGSSAASRVGEASVGDLYGIASSPSLAQEAMNLPPVLRRFKRRPKSSWPLIAGVAAAIAIVVTGIVGVWFARASRPVESGAATRTDGPAASTPSIDSGKAAEIAETTRRNAEAEKTREMAQKKQEDEDKAKLNELTAAINGFRESVESALNKTTSEKRNADEQLKRADAASNESAPNPYAARSAAEEAGKAADRAKNAADEAGQGAKSARELYKPLANKFPELEVLVKKAEDAAGEAKTLVQVALESSSKAKKLVPIAVSAKIESDRRNAITDSVCRLDLRQVALPKREVTSRLKIGEVSPLAAGEYKLALIVGTSKKYAIEMAQSKRDGDKRIRAECSLALSSHPTGESSKPTIFASFEIDQNGTLFALWDGMAKSTENDCFKHSEDLRNCILTLSWRGTRARIQLRECQAMAPLKLPMTSLPPRNPETVDASLEGLPDDAQIEVEPLNVGTSESDKGIPWNCTSGSWSAAVGSLRPAYFSLTGEKTTNKSRKRVFQIALKFDGIEWNNDYNERINGNCERRTDVTVPIIQNELKKVRDRLEELNKGRPPNNNRSEIEKEKQGLKKEIEKLEELEKTHERLLKISSLPYRIVMKVGEEKIVLYATTDKPHTQNQK